MKPIKITFSALLIMFSLSTYSQSGDWAKAGNSLSGNEKLGSKNKFPVKFFTNNTERMILDTAGRLGIGTTFPLAALHVMKGDAFIAPHPNSIIAAESNSDAFISVAAPELKKTGILFATRVNGIVFQADGGIIYNEQGAVRGMEFNTGGNLTRMVVASNGFVGIGTKAPASELHIVHADGFAHGLRIQNSTAGGNSWTVFQFADGDLGLGFSGSSGHRGFFNHNSGEYFFVSDSRLKKNIERMPDVMERVLKLEVKDYNLLEEKQTDRKHYGLIAQDVEKLFPEIVSHKTDNGHDVYAVNYSAYGVIAIKAIQEQQKKIEAQEQTNYEQQKTIDELRTMVNDLKLKVAQLLGPSVSTNTPSTPIKNDLTATTTQLEQNIPNPFGSATTISYTLPEGRRNAQIEIFSMGGQLVKTYPIRQSGKGQVSVSAGALSSGTYQYVLKVDGVSIASKQMLVIK